MKELFRRLILAAGYEIRHKSVAPRDPFRRQNLLLQSIAEPVIFDVGANIGTMAQKYRLTFPRAIIHAFEPFPESFAQLEKNVGGDNRIFPWRLALGSAAGRSTLRVNAASVTNSLLETDTAAMPLWGGNLLATASTIEVETETVDEFCRRKEIGFIHVLKLDTQGTELEILRGAAEMLSTERIGLIYTEVIVAPSYKGQARPHEIMGYLDGFGYHLSGVYNLWSHQDGRLLQMDAIFVGSGNPAMPPVPTGGPK